MTQDAIVIGGSFAGLSAATYIARGRRSVCVIDTGSPRNRFAEHSHGFFTHDGSPPGTILAAAREQVAAYPTVSFIEGRATHAENQSDHFAVELETGQAIVECFQAGSGRCVITPSCRLKGMLASAEGAFLDHLDTFTLADCALEPDAIERLKRDHR